ncbi:MAG: PrsW family intramembrane metalloprotease [Acidimicrobiia bacterium]|nr:PrsW family intramembrane metalloprotease [Acidimicrobiia bacterium]
MLALATGLLSAIWIILSPETALPVGLVLGSASVPAAVLFAVAGRLDAPISLRALIGGGTIGVGIALLSHAVVFAFAYSFFLGFAEAGTSALEALRIDPKFTSVLRSPWTILILLELTLVAPITEEAGKALGGFVARPTTRRDAFLAGVAAGIGFAIVENIAYGVGGLFGFDTWEPIVLGRMLGAAVHPLASGLVVLGWWERRNGVDAGAGIGRLIAGVAVHAAWNGALVITSIAGIAYDYGGASGNFAAASLAYTGLIGVLAAGALWVTASSVSGEIAAADLAPTNGHALAGWTVLASSFLVPVALLVLAFPELSDAG